MNNQFSLEAPMLAHNTYSMLGNQPQQFYSVVVGELISTTITGIIAVVLVGFILIEHWTATVFVLPLTLVLYIDLLGEQALTVLVCSCDQSRAPSVTLTRPPSPLRNPTICRTLYQHCDLCLYGKYQGFASMECPAP